MTYDVDLADRVRAGLAGRGAIREVSMFGGLSFMVNGKMAVAVRRDGELLLRVDPQQADELLAEPGASEAQMGAGRSMSKGWLSVSRDVLAVDRRLRDWLEVALAFNEQTANS